MEDCTFFDHLADEDFGEPGDDLRDVHAWVRTEGGVDELEWEVGL